jgi:hypothetical protein
MLVATAEENPGRVDGQKKASAGDFRHYRWRAAMKRRQHFAIGDIVLDDDGERAVVVHLFDKPLRDILVVVRYTGSRDGVAVPSDLLRREG